MFDPVASAHAPDNGNESYSPRRYEPKKLNDLHKEICMLAAMGARRKEICSRTGASPAVVSNITNSVLGRERIERIRQARDEEAKDVSNTLRKLTDKFLDRLEEIAEDPQADSKTVARVGLGLLDRTGHGPVKKVEGRHLHGVVTGDQIAALKQRAVREGIIPSVLLDDGVITVEKEES